MRRTWGILANTGLLQLRQIALLLTDLVAVRLVLSALGVSGYGVYATVAGFVSSFALLHTVIQTLAQRFLSAEFSRDENGELAHAFSSVLCLSLCLCALIVLIGETAGLWFLTANLSFPDEYRLPSRLVYHLCLLTVVVRTLHLPFTSLIVASERMAFLLGLTVFESLMTAGTVVAVWCRPSLGVTGYAAGVSIVSFALLLILVAHCRKRFFSPGFFFRCRLWRFCQQGGFLLWSTLSTVANALKYQGVNVLVNLYAGVSCNATWMVAMKVCFGVGLLIGNFQQAFQPRLVRHWIEGDLAMFWRLLALALRGSFLMTSVCVAPFLICPHLVLSLWLGDVSPPHAAEFVRCIAVHCLLDALTGPLTTAIVATGRIARYQIGVSIAMGSGFFLAWALLAAGLPPWTAAAAVAATNALSLVQRLVYMQRVMGLRVAALFARAFFVI